MEYLKLKLQELMKENMNLNFNKKRYENEFTKT